jgi:methylated-DNA-[protein]-cysteine S-methyltransferase
VLEVAFGDGAPDAHDPHGAADILRAYFAGDLGAIDALPVRPQGTEFQVEVWAALREIPVGTTTSYGALAASLGRPKAVRAVGRANGTNPVAIVLPCHRVVGHDGRLTGYGGGLAAKRWLLSHEGAPGYLVP